jgi:MATE family multidrug resistance protein
MGMGLPAATGPPSRRVELRVALRHLLLLAVPVILAELGWMAMGIVDTIMVGPLGPEAIGAVGIGSGLFMAVAIFGMGLLLGLDTLVAQSFGAGRMDECHRWLAHGVVLALLIAAPMTVVLLGGLSLLRHIGLHRDVMRLTLPYVAAVTWSLLPLLFYATFRRYLQGIAIVRPIAFALVSANIVNIAANWVLIYGRLGLPALGVTGAAVATTVSRAYMAAVLLIAILLHDRRIQGRLAAAIGSIEWARLARLVRLGFPAAAQLTLEIGAFATATALAGKLDPMAVASHQIALNVAAFVFMVPLGIASAGAVTVGHAVGRGNPREAAVSGWTALGVVSIFMIAIATVLVTTPKPLIRVFTAEPAVVAIGIRLLAIAAVFQLFDGLQVVATGVLRGIGDTRTPMLWNLAGHWMLGLPVGYTLCFPLRYGVTGLWIGFSVGLITVGIVLVTVWARRVQYFTPAMPKDERRRRHRIARTGTAPPGARQSSASGADRA